MSRAMNLCSIINSNDLGGLAHGVLQLASTSNLSTEAVLDDDTEPRRSARTRPRPSFVSSDTASSDLARPSSIHTAGAKDKPNGVTKTKAVRVRRIRPPPAVGLSGSGRGDALASTHGAKGKRNRDARTSANETSRTATHHHKRPRSSFKTAQPQLSTAQELVRRARAAGSYGRQSVMDIVLNAQPPNRRLYVEDLQDAIEECYRTALSVPVSDADNTLADMFVPGRYAARQAALAEAIYVVPEEFTANEIYRVSAERSTATWEPSLSDDNASMDTQL